MKPADIVFLNLSFKKMVKIIPNKNNTNGILLPDNIMPIPKMHIKIAINTNLIFFFFSNTKVAKNIEKKEKFCIKPPAINSSPKNPEL